MIRKAFLAITILAGVFSTSTALYAQVQNGVYGELLTKYGLEEPGGVNLVDYARWKRTAPDLERLAIYIGQLQAQKPSGMARSEAFAYWVNLYNAATLKVVLDNYPVASIRDIKSTGTGFFDFKALTGPWRTKFLQVEGRDLSLDDIEHEILRPTFKDPRVHYAVNCASIGCPNLKLTPWTAASLDADLDAAAKAYINHQRGVSIRKDGRVVLSSIYDWFKEHFGGNDKGVISHLRKYAEPELAKRLSDKTSIAGYDYDWALNEGKGKRPAG